MSLQVHCPYCDRPYRLNDAARGQRLRCSTPDCAREFLVVADNLVQKMSATGTVSLISTSRPKAGTKTASSDTGVPTPSRESPVRKAPPPLARPVEAPLARPVELRICECCGTELSEHAVVCNACGTDLETGRRIVRAKDWDRDSEREEVAAGWLGWASIWLSPSVVVIALALLFTGHPVFGILSLVLGFMPIPYASEAPIRRRPMALLLIVAIEFLVFPASYSDWWVTQFAMWAGDPAVPRPVPEGVDPDVFAEIVTKLPVGKFAWYQLVTAQFLHGDAWHLAFNMALLLVLGPKVNDVLGNLGFAAVYLGLGAAAGLSHIYSASGGPVTAGLGASGSAMVIAGMYAIFSPQHRIRMVAWFRVFLLTPLFCWPFRIRGLWLILVMVAMDLIPILTNAESNVGHGVHFIGFISGASVAAFLVALKKVNCGGYDLLSWCFGQEEIARDVVVSQRATDTWTRVLNHPVFMAGVMLMCAVSFLISVVQGVWSQDELSPDWDGSSFPAASPTAPSFVATPTATPPPADMPAAPPPLGAPAPQSTGNVAQKSNIVLSNARMWRSERLGPRSHEFSVDFLIEGADTIPGDTYKWVIKPASGLGATKILLWVSVTTQGSPGRMGSQGTLSGTVLQIDPNTSGTVETFVEVENWNSSGRSRTHRVRERISNAISFQLVGDPSPDTGPFIGPGGIPGGRDGLPSRPGGMPGGLPGGPPGGQPGVPPSGFPRGRPGRG